jgi:hypothetical protein
MTTLTEIVAAVVVHSSAVALSHFGVTMDPAEADRAPPPAERVVARTHVQPQPQQHKVMKLTSCPQARHPTQPIKA